VTDKDYAAIHLSIGNRGDEGAYNVRAFVDVDGKRLAGKLKNSLGVNESYEVDFRTGISLQKPGRYPVMVTIEYTDNNMYPFTVLSANYINYMEPQNSRVLGMVPELTVSDSGSLQVVLSNIDREDRKVVVRPMAPKEFFFTDTRREVLVKSGEKKPVSFSVRNLAAYPEQVYGVCRHRIRRRRVSLHFDCGRPDCGAQGNLSEYLQNTADCSPGRSCVRPCIL
ncbi:MAG: hypothetical protein L7F78_18190, partial [Syntrophales bacterium LBB04]|nr:hypothetical protein [Syntrophales bacterium LBB04]